MIVLPVDWCVTCRAVRCLLVSLLVHQTDPVLSPLSPAVTDCKLTRPQEYCVTWSLEVSWQLNDANLPQTLPVIIILHDPLLGSHQWSATRHIHPHLVIQQQQP